MQNTLTKETVILIHDNKFGRRLEERQSGQQIVKTANMTDEEWQEKIDNFLLQFKDTYIRYEEV